MTRSQLELIRNLIRAEIDYALAKRKEGSDGYGQSAHAERDIADSIFLSLTGKDKKCSLDELQLGKYYACTPKPTASKEVLTFFAVNLLGIVEGRLLEIAGNNLILKCPYDSYNTLVNVTEWTVREFIYDEARGKKHEDIFDRLR